MHLPTALCVVLIVAGAWSLVVSALALRRVWNTQQTDAAGSARTGSGLQLMVVSISMVLALATAVIGIRALIS